MTAYEFDKSSWHYWVAKMGGLSISSRHPETDLCSYIRKFIWGSIVVAFLSGLAFLVAFIEVHFIVALIVSAIQGIWVIEGWAQAGAILTGIITVLASGTGLAVWRDEWKAKHPKEMKVKEPGFITLAYRGWKDKYCIQIKIIDKTIPVEAPEVVEADAALDDIIKDMDAHDE